MVAPLLPRVVMRASVPLRSSAVLVASLALVTLPSRPPTSAETPAVTATSGGSIALPPCGGQGQPKCIPIASIQSHTHPAGAKAPEVTVNYTITVRNNGQGDGSGFFEVQCYGGSGLINCNSATPGGFNLDPGQQQVVAISYTTGGLRTYVHKIKITAFGEWGGTPDSVSFTVPVVGAGIATHLNPGEMMDLMGGDTIRIVYAHPSGVNTATSKLFIDGVDSTNRSTLTGNTRTAVLGLAGDYHKLGSYVCATNGRCDSIFTNYRAIGVSAQANIDDDLPLPTGEPASSLLPGALPLPPDSLRGCPITTDHPEIRLISPFSYITQPANGTTPAGTIFMAGVSWWDGQPGSRRVTINTSNVDLVPADNRSCATITFLGESDYDWNFWVHTDPNDPMWASYPYGDRMSLMAGRAAVQERGLVSRRGLNSDEPVDGARGAASLRRKTGRVPTPFPRIEWPGGIVTTSYKVWLNGTLIIDNSTPVVSGVYVESTAPTGLSAYVDVPHTLINVYDLQQPSNNNGGWNEMIASVADSGGRRSYVRARFAQAPPRAIGPLVVTPRRAFDQLDQGECAAFGAFQCGGVMLTHPLPGFITRDKPRGLNLLYRSASQSARTILPHELYVNRLGAAPDSVKAFTRVGGVASGDILRYYGLNLPAGAPEDLRLAENNHERRIVGAILDSSTASPAIRQATTVVRAFYDGLGTRDDTVRQDVVQIRLTDTVATRFGPGWQLAELSRLLFGQTYKGAPAAIWLSGDGSYSIFTQVGGVWTSPLGETAKLLDSTVTSGLTARWVVSLANGASIGYTASGWQQFTADLLGNKTVYAYNGIRLSQITDPAGHRYEFSYDSTVVPKGQVSSILMRAPSGETGEVATLRYTSGRLGKVLIRRTASQVDTTHYLYATSPFGAYVSAVVDPRSTPSDSIVTKLAYDSVYWTPKTLTLPRSNSGISSVQTIRDPWRRAVPREGRGRGTQLAERMLYPNQARGSHIGSGNFGPWTDYTIDPFGGPTSVRIISPQPVMGPGFQMITFGGDMTRHITRDSLGRVTKIVAAQDSALISDSVVYRYDVHNNLDRLIKSTAEFPVGTNALDTISFVYDSASISATQRCRRLRSMTDAMGGITRVRYDSAGSGVRPCLPIQAIGLAADTTKFAYGALTVGNAAGVRPIKTVDPVGLADSVAYDATTWNTATHVRIADGATSRAFYGKFGLPDSLLDPVNTPTHIRYDLSGRVIRTKTGTGLTAPMTRSHYNSNGLTDSVEVFAATNIDEMIVVGSIQTTRNYFNRLGQMDSTLTPGSRTVEPKARRQWFKWDANGNARQEFNGAGSWIGRSSDWLGRVEWQIYSEVLPGYSIDGENYADATTDSAYRYYGLASGRTLSMGQAYRIVYDNKGRVAREVTSQTSMPFNPDSSWVKRKGYSRVGALVADTTNFSDSMRVVRRYQYNRRGQRTLAATTFSHTGSGTFTGGSVDTTRYYYSTATARLDSMVTKLAASDTVGRVRWLYDRAGRDTLRAVRLKGTACELKARKVYGAVGRLNQLQVLTEAGACTGPVGTWYSMTNPLYTSIDELVRNDGYRPVASGGPSLAVAYTDSSSYATDGTRRLTFTLRTGPGVDYSSRLYYDVFGNKARETSWVGDSMGSCQPNDTLYYAPDNRLLRVSHRVSPITCPDDNRYWSDRAGNRLMQTDTINGTYTGMSAIMSYTAKQQIFFALSKAGLPGEYYYNWNFYDASGMRMVTQTKLRSGWDFWEAPTLTNGTRNYYIYDGNDVVVTLVRHSNGAWWVRSRYMVGGLDQPLAGRFVYAAGSGRNLALVTDRQGTTVAAMDSTGTQETMVSYFSRDPWGKLLSGGSDNTINTEVGFAGASTPNQSGGFTYLRNRWYDPQTGRFLTQDPIGLAGGINLYSYAGNNPVAFSDPFGLCVPPLTPLCIVAYGIGIGAGVFAGTRLAYNAATDRPLTENLQSDVARGALLGLAGGMAPAAGAAITSAMAPASASIPIVGSAAPKLEALADRFGTTSSNIVNTALTTGKRLIDNANGGNINALIPRLDGASGFIRVTLDPAGQQVISAGLMRANQVANGIASGRFTPVE